MTTVVIVPGSFSPAPLYDSFIEFLAKHGVKAVAASLASVGRKETPGTMSDDVDSISKVVTELLDAGQEVVLLTHSYGGIPGTQSLEHLSDKARRASGKSGVKKIIYMTSVVLPVGVSNFDGFGSALPKWLTVEDDYMMLDDAETAALTFSDVPVEVGLPLAQAMDDHSTASFKEKLRYAGYNDVEEIHYILCEDDKVIPLQFQQAMIDQVKESSGKDITVHKVKAGHAPTVSQPDRLLEIIQQVIGAN